jgi:hypothetical protein
VLLTELVVAIEATLIIFENHTASAGNIAIVIDGSTLATEEPIQESSLIALEYREVARSLRSAVHLERYLNMVARLECTEVVCQLLGISVLLEQGSGCHLGLASAVALGHTANTVLGTRDILLANLVTIHKAVNDIASTQFDGSIAVCVAVVETRNGEEQAIRLLATKANGGHVTLVGIHIATDVVAGVVLLAEKVVLLCELYG